MTPERQLEEQLIEKLRGLKYEYRADIRDRAALEKNFREKFEALNRVHLTDGEFPRLLDEIVTPDVFTAAHTLREPQQLHPRRRHPAQLHAGQHQGLVQEHLRGRQPAPHQHRQQPPPLRRHPAHQRRARRPDRTEDPRHQPAPRHASRSSNTRTIPATATPARCSASCSSSSSATATDTYYFANNNARHFAFNADERFLPIYQFAGDDNTKITHLDDFADAFLAKCTLGQMISRYMVLVASEQKLLMMRPYQIYAVKPSSSASTRTAATATSGTPPAAARRSPPSRPPRCSRTTPTSTNACSSWTAKTSTARPARSSTASRKAASKKTPTPRALVRRLLSDDYADKVIVTTIQKLGLALDENSKRNKGREKKGQATYKDRLEPLRDKRMVFIFDECHRSQFGDNHKAIKEFFPNAQLFGFTGTPIFEENASYQADRRRRQASLQNHAGPLPEATARLHHHPRHRRPQRPALPRRLLQARRQEAAQAGRDARQASHRRSHPRQARRRHRRAQVQRPAGHRLHQRRHRIPRACSRRSTGRDSRPPTPTFVPLNIACVFSPPAEGNKDVQQIQEDLPQEKADNKQDPGEEEGRAQGHHRRLQRPIRHQPQHRASSTSTTRTCRSASRTSNTPMPTCRKGREKIDITIVVDMLLTGFDSKYLNTLYVDKNLKHHGLIQAFSRTNRVLNDTKPYGNILDFRQQQEAVDAAIALFSGAKVEQAREIWLVDKAPVVIDKLKDASDRARQLHEVAGPRPASPKTWPTSRATTPAPPSSSTSRKCSGSRPSSTNTPTSPPEQEQTIQTILPQDDLNAFRGQYLETAQRLRDAAATSPATKTDPAVDQLDFEFVLFASAVIDYDYIMELIARLPGQAGRASRR